MIFRLERGSSYRLLDPIEAAAASSWISSKRPPPPGSQGRGLLDPLADASFSLTSSLAPQWSHIGENSGDGIDANYGVGLRSSHLSCGIEVCCFDNRGVRRSSVPLHKLN
jgi:hypothetical protein